MAAEIERRFLSVEMADHPVRVERRKAVITGKGGDIEEVEQDWLVGYAARFGVESLDLGDFVERIDPGAFALVSQKRGRKPLDTRGLYNHDPNFVLGRFPRTMNLTVDEIGLRYEVLPPAGLAWIVESIQRGDVTGSSFAFRTAKNGDRWEVDERGRHVRTVTSVSELLDVGPVTYPAYPDADVTAAKRSYEAFMKESKGRGDRKAAVLARAAALAEWKAANV